MSGSSFPNRSKRPLPPPQSREAVLLQLEQVSGWTTIDNNEDLRICIPRKRVRTSEGHGSRTASTSNLGSRSLLADRTTSNLRINNRIPPVLSLGNSTLRKKTLFGSEARHRQVRELIRADESDRLRCGPNQAARQSPESWSFEGFPSIHTNYPLVDDQAEAFRLASATNADLCSHKVVTTFPDPAEPCNEDLLTNGVHSVPEVTEDNSTERSRQLRERALARRHNEEQFGAADPPNRFASALVETDEVNLADSEENLEMQVDSSVPHYAYSNEDAESVSNEDAESVSNEEQLAPVDIDVLFNIAESARGTDKFLFTSNMNKPDHRASVKHNPHPASRAAAELYRTQSRHLAQKLQPRMDDSQNTLEVREGEQRLRLLTSQTGNHFETAKSKPLGTIMDSSHQTSPRTSIVESPQPICLGSETQPPETDNTGIASEEPNDEALPFGNIATVKVVDQPQERVDTLGRNGGLELSLSSLLKSTFPPLRLDKTNAHPTQLPTCKVPASTPASTPAVSEDHTAYPITPPELTLPSKFDQYDDETKAIVLECERKKELERDLMVILPTFEQIARLGSLDQFKICEKNELRTVQEYTRAVVDDGLSGKMMRNRISGIRDNMKRRIQRCSPPDEYEYEPLLNTLIKKERREHVAQLIATVRDQLGRLRYERAEATSKRWHKRTKPTTHKKGNLKNMALKANRPKSATDVVTDATKPFSSTLDSVAKVLPTSKQAEHQSLSLSERKRNGQYAAADKREALIRTKLALFEVSVNTDNQNSDSLGGVDADGVEIQSETSEEEEGAEHFSRPMCSQSSPKNVATVVEDQIENASTPANDEDGAKVEGHGRYQGSQAYDEGLAISMLQRLGQRDILEEDNTQIPNVEPISTREENDVSGSMLQDEPQDEGETESPCEFDDMYDSSSDDESCYRYVVKAQHAGITNREEGYEYCLGRYLDSTLARNTLEAHVQSLKEDNEKQENTGLPPTVRVELIEEQGLITQHVEFGKDGRSSCNIWIEKEEVQASTTTAYKHAKVRRACHSRPVYIVLWQRIRTALFSSTNNLAAPSDHNDEKIRMNTQYEPATDQTRSSADVDDDDLFGPEPPETQVRSMVPTQADEASLEPIIENIQVDALRHFSNVAGANRHAKEVFMRWYMDHLQGRENHRHIAREELAMEVQLQGCGDSDTWTSEADFDVYTDVEGEVEDDESKATKTRESRFKHNERFKVWVEMRQVIGPAN